MKDARARERYLKSGMGKRYLKNRLNSFSETFNGVDESLDKGV